MTIFLNDAYPAYPASDVPARYVFEYFFQRSKIGQGAAAAVMMVMTMILIVLPYLYYEIRRKEI